MENQLCEAIVDRRLLRIRYKGEERIVETYTYGINIKDNKAVKVYQRSGGSASGNNTGWKMMLLDDLNITEMMEERFEIHKEYNINDKGMTKIICQVSL